MKHNMSKCDYLVAVPPFSIFYLKCAIIVQSYWIKVLFALVFQVLPLQHMFHNIYGAERYAIYLQMGKYETPEEYCKRHCDGEEKQI